MKKTFKNLAAVILTVTLIVSLFTVSFSVSAADIGKVRVIIKNEVFDVEDGAAWDGVLVDEWVDIDEDSTMMSAVVTALDNNGYTQEGAESGYISTINGLSQMDSSFMSGWMGTLNDWFTNEGFSAFTVENGTLEAGDEICIQYTDLFGADIGCMWDVPYTYLDQLEIEGGTLDSSFDSDETDYVLTLDKGASSVKLTPTAFNKCYQVRTYKNEYHPESQADYKRNDSIDVQDGDVLYIGVGNESWPSMGNPDEETVYTLRIEAQQPEKIGEVKIQIDNNTYSSANGAAWDGALVDEWVTLYDNSTMESAIKSALDEKGYPYSISSYGYFSEVNGLEEFSYNGNGGWMAALNDWFTTSAPVNYSVENGKLRDGDVLSLQFTCNWGSDVGSLWGNSDTSLAYLTADAGKLDREFNSADTEYTLYIGENVNSVLFDFAAVNKNYQARLYKNEYTPDVDGTELVKSREFEIADGDTVYIAIGHTGWDTMNEPAQETVYTIKIKNEEPVEHKFGDVNFDGEVNIYDATLVQRYVAGIEPLTEEQLSAADVSGDGAINIYDATVIQRIVAGLIQTEA